MEVMERIAYRPGEFADAIGVSRSKAYELIARGEIPSVRIGSSLRIPVEAVREWMAKKIEQGA